MLALTDSALAHLVIAATAVPQNERRRWLQRVAEQLEPRITEAGRRALTKMSK